MIQFLIKNGDLNSIPFLFIIDVAFSESIICAPYMRIGQMFAVHLKQEAHSARPRGHAEDFYLSYANHFDLHG